MEVPHDVEQGVKTGIDAGEPAEHGQPVAPVQQGEAEHLQGRGKGVEPGTDFERDGHGEEATGGGGEDAPDQLRTGSTARQHDRGSNH